MSQDSFFRIISLILGESILSFDAIFFNSYTPHRSGPNMTNNRRRVLYVTYNAASEGDHRREYYADKRLSYPPDIEREPNKKYVFRV